MKRTKSMANKEMTASNPTSNNTALEIPVRTTGRVKKPKTVFDPSDNYIPRTQRNAVTQNKVNPHNNNQAISTKIQNSSNQQRKTTNSKRIVQNNDLGFDTCVICMKSEPKRGQGVRSQFIKCKTCGRKRHFACLPIDFQNESWARRMYKCDSCRLCSICGTYKIMHDTLKCKDLIMCSVCVKAFHLDCHVPNVDNTKLKLRNWICKNCEIKPESIIDAKSVITSKKKTKSATKARSTKPTSTCTKQIFNKQKTEVTIKLKRMISIDTSNKMKKKTETAATDDSQRQPKSQNETTDANAMKPSISNDSQKNLSESKSAITATSTTIATSAPITTSAAATTVTTSNKEDINEIKKEKDVTIDDNGLNSENEENVAYYNLCRKDIAKWAVSDVTLFIKKHYPKEASSFTEHGIDGPSLLLLKRFDIMKKFNLKLGQSLRLYELINILQTRQDSIVNCWNA